MLLSGVSARADCEAGFEALEIADYEQALRHLLPCAEAGNAIAQFNLGLMYDLGEGVPQDSAEAARWYHRAARQGDAPAQYNLGVMYAHGEGVPQDDAEAVRWYRMAADQGHAKAQNNLGLMYENGRGVAQDHAEAMRWYRIAADNGDVQAQFNLGVAYYYGEGVPQDDVLAYMWSNLAAARAPSGELRRRATELRDEIAARLTPAQRARGQELARNWQPSVAAGSEGALERRAEIDRRASRNRAVQQRLADLGYDPGPVDGVVGPSTRAAIRAFQADAGLPVDGEISEGLYAALESAETPKGESSDRWWDEYPALDSTGTGFAVSQDGHLLTNHHVVADCVVVRVQPPRGEAVEDWSDILDFEGVQPASGEAAAAVIVARDPNNDLALLRAPVRLPAAAHLDDRGIRPGDSVIAVGFPLPGLLASEASVTTGTVSALAGIGNDTRLLQMTVPVQPGNSGGPLLDLHGRVVGVVVGKLDALEVANVTGDIPQNVNFAIKAGVARSFLEASGVASTEMLADEELGILGGEPQELSAATIGAQAKKFTVLVECWR
ncbi:MAG: trypsin-like peptidase domain-containing protein [Geminicoccaceae bacterium]